MKSLVRLHRDRGEDYDFVNLHVTNREFGHKYVTIFMKKLSEAMGNPNTTVYDKDCYRFIELWYDNTRNFLCIRITWLSDCTKWQIYDSENKYDKRQLDKLEGKNPACRRGYEQTLRLNADKVFLFTETEKDVKFFYDDEAVKYPKITLTETGHRRVRKILQEQGTVGRRSLTRFFKKNFQYPWTKEIVVYDDPWTDGFGFREDTGTVGGIIPETLNVLAGNGRHYPKTDFAIHT